MSQKEIRTDLFWSSLPTSKFIHDCQSCIFLAHFLDKDVTVDIYWCKNPGMSSLDSVLGRYGNRGEEYFSSNPLEAFSGAESYLNIASKWYIFALLQANKLGLYSPQKICIKKIHEKFYANSSS